MKNINSLLIIFILLMSCDNQSNKLKNNLNDIQSITIKTDSLEVLNHSDLNNKLKYNYYVFTYVNTACPSCLNELDQWKNLGKTLAKYNCGLKVIGYSDDDFVFFRYLLKENKVPKLEEPYLLDTANIFKRPNSPFLVKNTDKTVLTNKNGKILAAGDPLSDKKILNQYINICNENIQ